MTPSKKREVDRAAKKKYLEVPFNRYKSTVRNLVYMAVECGIIVRPKSCEQCDSTTELEGHHEDYSEPLVVEWLCGSCHSARHLKTHCKRGHEFTEENTYVAADGGRVCRPCAAMRARRRRAVGTDDALASAQAQIAAAREILSGEVK